MRFRTWFEKQVFVRLTEDHAAFVSTMKWPIFSRTRRVSIEETGRDGASRVREPGSIAAEKLRVLRHSPVEQGSTHRTTVFEGRIREL